MTKQECAIISAYTGISFGCKAFDSFHEYVENKFKRPVWTHEMGSPEFWKELKELSKNDFLHIVDNIRD